MTDRHWSIMTKSRGGTVSVLRDLTLDEARAMYLRLDPEFGRTYGRFMLEGGGSKYYSSNGASRDPGGIEIREVFGPREWDSGEVETWASEWPKFIDLDHTGKPIA